MTELRYFCDEATDMAWEKIATRRLKNKPLIDISIKETTLVFTFKEDLSLHFTEPNRLSYTDSSIFQNIDNWMTNQSALEAWKTIIQINLIQKKLELDRIIVSSINSIVILFKNPECILTMNSIAIFEPGMSIITL